MKTQTKASVLKSFAFKLSCAVALVVSSSAASAAIMTFSGIPGSSTAMPSYTENGITAVSTSGGNFWGYPSAGQLHLDPSAFNNSSFDFNFGGLGFDLNAVDVSFASSGAIGTWTGYNAANVLVATYVMSGSTIHLDTAFAGFSDLYRVHLVNTGSHFSIDNLNMTASKVPEPISLALLSIGLLGMSASRRKKNQKN
ncbi:MAG: PEP-CTERM sorting domain-containing protein [Undibacterium sp.]|nr:PEP-CTERM sorting domain-containing protein [Undibacterium sp.]